MKIGTKSLLFGVHQVIYHPITVFIAWCKLYSWPSWKEFVCIVIHDWGYWGKPNMDGKEGEAHPEGGAKLVFKWFGFEYYWLCLYHSRHYARNEGEKPSKLCWADKLSITLVPEWLYMIQARLSGELYEYRARSAAAGYVPLEASNHEWFTWVSGWLANQGYGQQSAHRLANGENGTDCKHTEFLLCNYCPEVNSCKSAARVIGRELEGPNEETCRNAGALTGMYGPDE